MTQYNVTGMSCAFERQREKIARCRGFSQRYRNTQNQKKTYRIAHCPCSVDVFFNGTYDVGMAFAVIF